MKTIFKIMLGVIGAVAVLVVSNQIHQSQNRNALTPTQFRSIRLGSTLKQVEHKYGMPVPHMTQTTRMKGFNFNSITVYYNVKGGQIGDTYQLDFQHGRLDSKRVHPGQILHVHPGQQS